MKSQLKEFTQKIDNSINYKYFKKGNRYTHERLIHKKKGGFNDTSKIKIDNFNYDSDSLTNGDTN